MKSLIKKIIEEPKRGLYWTRIEFVNEKKTKKSQVLTCASEEYLEDYYKLKDNQILNQEHKDQWAGRVVKKWTELGQKIFQQDIHYDIYVNNKTEEANGLDFLIRKGVSY